MYKKLFLILAILLVLPMVTAQNENVYKQWENITISHAIRIDGAPSTSITANITIKDRNKKFLAQFAPMINNGSINEHEYLLKAGKTGELGVYEYTITATDGVQNTTQTFFFEVTPSGEKGLLGFYFLIIILSYGVLAFGLYKQDITVTALSSFALVFLGIYMLFFGIDIFKNYLTNAFSLITIGIGSYVGLRAAHEYVID